jgi:hypothetical protein
MQSRCRGRQYNKRCNRKHDVGVLVRYQQPTGREYSIQRVCVGVKLYVTISASSITHVRIVPTHDDARHSKHNGLFELLEL